MRTAGSAPQHNPWKAMVAHHKPQSTRNGIEKIIGTNQQKSDTCVTQHEKKASKKAVVAASSTIFGQQRKSTEKNQQLSIHRKINEFIG
jgi:hypothetical protein